MDKLFVAMQLGFNICFLCALLALARGAVAEPANGRRHRLRSRRRDRRPEAVAGAETASARPGTTAPSAAPAESDDLGSMVSEVERREVTMNRPAPPARGNGPSAPAVAELQARIARFRRIRGGDAAAAPGRREDPAGPAISSGAASTFSRPTRAGSRGTRLARVTGMDGR